MKNKILFSLFLSSCLILGCQVDDISGIEHSSEYTVSFIANVESDEASLSQSKATMGVSPSGKLQTFWERGDMLSVYSSGNVVSGSTSTKVYYGFETTLTSPSSSAVFGYKGSDFVAGDQYVAIYPYTSNSPREVNFGAKVISSSDTRMAYHMSQMIVPQAQTLVAGGFDRKAAVAVAFSEDLSVMNFKNAVSLIKFKVADKNIISGSIKAEGSKIAGTFKACVLASDGHEPVLVDYSKGTYADVDFSLAGNSAFSTDAEYYVAVRPTELENGFSIYLNGTLIKKYNLTEIKRNVIYNLGELTLPQIPGDQMRKTLSFDFSTDENFVGDWPKADKWKTSAGDMECTYNLNGVNYSLLCTDCPDATSARTYWNSSNGCLIMAGQYRYVGLPVIDGYKLTKVTCLHGTAANAKGRGLAVTENVTNSKVTPTYVNGGEPKTTVTSGDWLTFELEGTSAGTRYYLNCSKTGIGLSNITLTYEKDGMQNSSSVRIGTYNVRVSKSDETDENNNWSNRKTRLVQSIKDCDFDVFGLNEYSADIRAYIENELSSTYSGVSFNPYSPTGIDDSNKVEYLGILYRKSVFTLTEWHGFWQAADLESSLSMPASHNDVDGEKQYYRGGCCCILTHNATGKKVFMMVAHGCLAQENRDRYAATFAAIEQKFNPEGYPSFFVGDMNARPSSQTSATYRQHWKDSYLELYPAQVNGPFSTFNGFSLDRDMMTDPRRIDYIYYLGASPFNYVCSDTKYDGFYPSDHCPVYVDVILE